MASPLADRDGGDCTTKVDYDSPSARRGLLRGPSDRLAAPDIDRAKLEALQGKVMGDVGGAMGLLMAYIGDQTGAYEALERAGPCTAESLAAEIGGDPRYTREWLSSNAALGYVAYAAASDRFSLTPEQAAVLAHDGEPTCMQGFFQAVVSQYENHDTAVDVFRSGRGRPWGEHSACCCCGTDRFFRPGYAASLIDAWIPALEGVSDRLRTGARIADVGCGLGSSSRLLAEAYPNATVHGFGFHEASIAMAREQAERAGLGNVRFDVHSAQDFPGNEYDLVCIFDALHDMGDPVGAARHIREVLKPDGTFMLVEPLAGDKLTDNLHLLGAIFYGFSTLVCVPTSRAQQVGACLGAQAGERRLREVLNEAGFRHVRRAAETPTNMVLEVRP
jgi:2-polyprenyl-3-methyl-5-hydroxy-6-metoxy-1,4-benzoquinol methylase